MTNSQKRALKRQGNKNIISRDDMKKRRHLFLSIEKIHSDDELRKIIYPSVLASDGDIDVYAIPEMRSSVNKIILEAIGCRELETDKSVLASKMEIHTDSLIDTINKVATRNENGEVIIPTITIPNGVDIGNYLKTLAIQQDPFLQDKLDTMQANNIAKNEARGKRHINMCAESWEATAPTHCAV